MRYASGEEVMVGDVVRVVLGEAAYLHGPDELVIRYIEGLEIVVFGVGSGLWLYQVLQLHFVRRGGDK